ncbi:MAG: hypothetical protein M1825_002715 [Sarcosagium campestre]|nr:MAG: hypothetical protein M1825_002715 [Sarcosagium campestre]
MAPVADADIFFPPLDKCLDSQQPIISWATALNAVSSPSPSFRRTAPIDRFLHDEQTTSHLVNPLKYFSAASRRARALFENQTAAIHVTPAANGKYKIEQIKEDVLWLSKTADIDEVAALRIGVIEWQARPRDQLLEDSSRDVASSSLGSSQINLGATIPFVSSVFPLTASRNGAAPSDFDSTESRRWRLLRYYLSERCSIVKLSELLIRSALAGGEIGPESDHQEQSSPRLATEWLTSLGRTLLEARIGAMEEGAGKLSIFTEATEALDERYKGLGLGSAFVGDLEHFEVEAEWVRYRMMEMIHILQLMFTVADSMSEIPPSKAVSAWFQFVGKYASLDILDFSFGDSDSLKTAFQSFIAVVSLAVLKLPFCMKQLLEQPDQPLGAIAAEDKNLLSDPAGFKEIHQIMLDMAEAGSAPASPAIYTWSIICQTLRDVVLSKTEARELRQSERAIDGFTEMTSSDTEEGETPDGPRLASKRPSRDSDASSETGIYGEIFEVLGQADSHFGEDTIAYLAKSAVNGSDVYELIAQLSTEFCPTWGGEGFGELGLRMRMNLLELVRYSLGLVEYSPQVLAAALAVLTGNEDFWLFASRPSLPDVFSPASVFLNDHIILAPKLLEMAYARFPFEPIPFLRICRGLSAHDELNDSGNLVTTSMLENMQTFTHALPEAFRAFDTIREEENTNQVVLTADLDLFRDRRSGASLRLTNNTKGKGKQSAAVARGQGLTDGVVIAAGSDGRVLLESGPIVVQWNFTYSALLYLRRLLETSTANSNVVDSSTGLGADKLVAAEIVATFATLLAASLKGGGSGSQSQSGGLEAARNLLSVSGDDVDAGRDIVGSIYSTFENELQQHHQEEDVDASLSILVHSVEFTRTLLDVTPGRVWPFLARSELLELDGRGGKLAAVVTSTEMVRGRFDFLVACIHLYEGLVDDAVTKAISRKTATKNTTRFTEAESLGTGVPETTTKKVLLSMTRTMVDVYESLPGWKFDVTDEKLDINRRILCVFDKILEFTFGFDDQNPPEKKATAVLAPAAAHLVGAFLQPDSSDLSLRPLFQMLVDGIKRPLSIPHPHLIRPWISQTCAAVCFCISLVSVNVLLKRPRSRLESRLLESSAVLAQLYCAHNEYRLPIVNLFEAVVVSISSLDGNDQPPSLLAHLGPRLAKSFLTVLSSLDAPLDDDDLHAGIWNVLSAVIGSGQQWLAVYLLTGKEPRESLKDGKDAASSRGRSMLSVALGTLEDIDKVPQRRALAMLQFVMLAQDQWSWTMSALVKHPKFLPSILGHVSELETELDARSAEKNIEVCNEIQIASCIAEILAMHLYQSRQIGDSSFVKKVLPHIAYYTDYAVTVAAYNQSLHANLSRNFEARYGLPLSHFRRTALRPKAFGKGFVYDVEVLQEMAKYDQSWNGRRQGDGLAEEVARANVNLSIVEAQMQLLKSWELLASELCNSLGREAGLEEIVAHAVRLCLEANSSTNLPEAIFRRIVQIRANFAFAMMQKVVDAGNVTREVELVLPTAWATIRASGTSFELGAGNADEVEYHRALLKILFLSLQCHQGGKSKPASTAASASTSKSPKSQRAQSDLLSIVVEIIDVVVGRGFYDLASALHSPSEQSSPGDLALVIGIFRSALAVDGAHSLHQQICSRLRHHDTARVATTLFSWSDQLLSDDGRPVYGELSILLLVELSTMKGMCEALAASGVLSHLTNTNLAALIMRGVSALSSPKVRQLHSIWCRGFLALCLNILSALGPVIAPEVARFINGFPNQLNLVSDALDGKTMNSSSDGQDASLVTLALASEMHSLALISRVLSAVRDAGAGSGVLPSEIPPLCWDEQAVRQDVKYFLGVPSVLRDRIVPACEADVVLARQDRLQAKVVAELSAVLDLLEPES